MLLYELAYACRIYAATFDVALERFQLAVNPLLDLQRADHRAALLTWLNKWGCHQFAKGHHQKASQEVLEWWTEQSLSSVLPRDIAWTDHLSNETLDAIEQAYASLTVRTASIRARKSVEHRVTFGPAGAAKILYVLWPQALPPWDDAIRRRLQLDGGPESYRRFLSEIVPREVESLRIDATRFGIGPADIPVRVARPDSSLPKLVDEYFWVTITQNYQPPSKGTLQEWATWAS
jgi:hypothetical protein